MPIQLLLLWLAFAWKPTTRNKLKLRIGAYYLKRGVGLAVGQAVPFKAMKHTKARTMYIDNLYFNFKTNTITHTMAKKPIEGFTQNAKN